MHAPLLLLGGAGLPGWIWNGLRERVPMETAVARYPAGDRAGLEGYADAVLDQTDWSSLVLVAHSLGGVVAAQVLARAPERVSGILAVSACVPAPGHSFLASQPFPQRLVVGTMMRLLGTRPPAGQIRSGLGAGLPAHVVARLVEDFKPESQAVYREPVAEHTYPARRGYVFSAQDPQFSLMQQERYAAQLDPAWTCQLDTRHLPMLEDPDGLAAAVRDFVGSDGTPTP